LHEALVDRIEHRGKRFPLTHRYQQLVVVDLQQRSSDPVVSSDMTEVVDRHLQCEIVESIAENLELHQLSEFDVLMLGLPQNIDKRCSLSEAENERDDGCSTATTCSRVLNPSNNQGGEHCAPESETPA
jgi:hypothetical protein